MQREEYTVGTWCVRWFEVNRHKWNPRTEGGYRNLIQNHIIPVIGSVKLTDLTEQLVTEFYEDLHRQGLSNRTIWCVHLLLRRCMDEAGRAGLIPCNPVRNCIVPKYEEHKPNRLRLGQIQRYLNTAEQLNILPMIYIGLTSGLRQCEVLALTWAAFHVPYKYIHQHGRLLTLNTKMLRRMHSEIIQRAGLTHIRFTDLRHTCAINALKNGMEVKELSQMLGHAKITTTRWDHSSYLSQSELKREAQQTTPELDELKQASMQMENLFEL